MSARTETWTLTHQGTLPGSRSQRRFIYDASPELGTFLVHGWEGDLCDLGVQAGDYISFHFSERLHCIAGDAVFSGDRFEFPILEVSRDSLTIGMDEGITVYDWSLLERPFLYSIGLPNEPQTVTKAPRADPRCLIGAESTEIRVPRGEYTVVGSLSGMQHGQKSLAGECIGASENETLQSEGVDSYQPGMDECVYPLPDDLFPQEQTYSNQAIFRIRPGCEVVENPEDPNSRETRTRNTPRQLLRLEKSLSRFEDKRGISQTLGSCSYTNPLVHSAQTDTIFR